MIMNASTTRICRKAKNPLPNGGGIFFGAFLNSILKNSLMKFVIETMTLPNFVQFFTQFGSIV